METSNDKFFESLEWQYAIGAIDFDTYQLYKAMSAKDTTRQDTSKDW